MPIQRKATCVLALALCLAPCQAQDATTTPSPAPLLATACAAPCLRANSIIELELLEPMSSRRHHRGDAYKLRTTTPVLVGGQTVVPAGTEVVGEVVHANKSRSGGQGGELLLAARSLQVGDISVRLKGMKLGASGQDLSAHALAASFVIGPLAMFVHGREIEIPAATRAHAKVAADVSMASAVSAASTLPTATPATPSN